MKSSIISFLTFGVFALSALASPLVADVNAAASLVAGHKEASVDAAASLVASHKEKSAEAAAALDITSQTSKYEDVDVILASLFVDIKITNTHFNQTCLNNCNQGHIKLWCQEVAEHCTKAITKCKKLPVGHLFPNKEKCVSLVVSILLEIHFTLKFLLGKCGLLGLLINVGNLVAVLITALNLLLIHVGALVVGLLASVKICLLDILGLVGCILCQLGLILA